MSLPETMCDYIQNIESIRIRIINTDVSVNSQWSAESVKILKFQKSHHKLTLHDSGDMHTLALHSTLPQNRICLYELMKTKPSYRKL